MAAQKNYPRIRAELLGVLISVMLCGLVLGQGSDPFTYSISVKKNTFVIGEPIAVTCTLKNVSSSARKIQRWRGLLAGVSTSGPDEFDFGVYRITGGKSKRIDYRGKFGCGPPSYMVLKAGETWQQTYVINNFLHSAYSLEQPGKYRLRSIYFTSAYKDNSDAYTGKLRAQDVTIKLVRLKARKLRRIRKQLSKGKQDAIAIVAAHHDLKAVPLLSKLCSSKNKKTRRLTHKALSVIGCDKALDALGRGISNEPDHSQRIEITRLLAEAGNTIAVPYLKGLLNDRYISIIGIDGKRYRQYTVRKWASIALNQLGVEDNTPYMEEFLEEIETIGVDKRGRLFDDAQSDDHEVQFDAVRQIAVMGYSAASTDILTRIACDSNVPETTRNYAAMGLGNFTKWISADVKVAIQQRLRSVVLTEKLDMPDGIIRLLAKWKDASFVCRSFGEQLKGHPLEIDVLGHIEDDSASDRLWEIYQQSPKGRKAEYYNVRAKVGRALTDKKDIRGIDILMTLLPVDSAPGPQHRNNVYNFLALRIGENFGYEGGNYRPELEQAIPKMISWWENNRSGFAF